MNKPVLQLLFLLALSASASAQQSATLPRSLGQSYAQLFNVTLNENLSSARYAIDGPTDATDSRLQVTRVPWRITTIALAGGELDWLLELGYLRLQAGLPLNELNPQANRIDARWTSYGASTGLRYRYPIFGALSLNPSVWHGLARLKNEATYSPAAEVLRPILDNRLFNWSTRARVTSFDAGISAKQQWQQVEGQLAAHLSHVRVDTYRESSSDVAFRETGNTLSIHGDLTGPTTLSLLDRKLHWSTQGSYTQFLGSANQIGFNKVVQLGGGLQLSLSRAPTSRTKLYVGAAALRGENVSGWSFSIGLRD